MLKKPIKVHGQLLTPHSLFARRGQKTSEESIPPDADDELNESDDGIDVDAELERADTYAPAAEATDEDSFEEEDAYDGEDEDEEEDEEEDEDVVSEDGYITDEEDVDADEAYENHNEEEESEMANKKVTLSDRIRQEIQRRVDAGGEVRGKDVVQTLAAKGHKVSPAQVSQLLKKMGVKSGGRAAPSGAKAAPTRAAARVTAPRAPERAQRPKRRALAEDTATVSEAVDGVRDQRGSLDPTTIRAARALLSAVGGDIEEAREYLAIANAMNIALADTE